MKRVILDEGVPWGVSRALPDHEVTSVQREGWDSIQNGRLLSLIERSGFNVFVTGDKNLQHQQDRLSERPFAILLLSTIHWPSVRPYVAKIADAVDVSEPGQLIAIECGRFPPMKRMPGP